MFGAADPSAAMLARHQPPLAINGIAIGMVGWASVYGDFSVAIVVAQHAVVGNVGPDQIASRGKIGGTFGPAAACIQAMQLSIGREKARKALVQDDEFVAGHAKYRLSEPPLALTHLATNSGAIYPHY